MQPIDELFRDIGKRMDKAVACTRWVRCSQCGLKSREELSGKKGFRLRDRVSRCCKARMRPLAWRLTPKGRALAEKLAARRISRDSPVKRS